MRNTLAKKDIMHAMIDILCTDFIKPIMYTFTLCFLYFLIQKFIHLYELKNIYAGKMKMCFSNMRIHIASFYFKHVNLRLLIICVLGLSICCATEKNSSWVC